MKAKAEEAELVHGSGNLYADLKLPSPELRQLKATLGAQIVRVLDAGELSVRVAQERTGVAAADFSRIRQAKLERFTVDRLMTILDRLGQKVKLDVAIRARRRRSV